MTLQSDGFVVVFMRPSDHMSGGKSGSKSGGVRCLITGANGYFGRRLASTLLTETDANSSSLGESIARIVLFDVSKPLRDPNPPVPDFAAALESGSVVKVSGDIRNRSDVDSAFDALIAPLSSGAVATDLIIFHAASFGMSGKEMVADPQKVRDINVRGTMHLLEAAGKFLSADQKDNNNNSGFTRTVRFVYTSTFNVVFGGDPANTIVNGDENTPYLPLKKHCDLYSQTKSIAEQAVLTANVSGKGAGLKTVALRSAVCVVLLCCVRAIFFVRVLTRLVLLGLVRRVFTERVRSVTYHVL